MEWLIALLQDLEQRDPVDPRRFHGHALHPACRQPVRKPVQISRVGFELPHWLVVSILRHRHEMIK